MPVIMSNTYKFPEHYGFPTFPSQPEQNFIIMYT